MLYTVSTVSAPLPAVRDFVEGNLSSGADHMFVFLDAPNADVEAFLEARACVTLVRCFDGYWQGKRPEKLAVRQNTNANVARVLLAPLPWPSWLAPLDVDECLAVDRAALETLDEDIETVQLRPMEAVSADGAQWRQWFKEKLGADQLELLAMLGHIDEPTNAALFYGSTAGRPVVRPDLSLRLTATTVLDPDGKALAPHHDAMFGMLHNGTVTLADFTDLAMTATSAPIPGGTRMRAAVTALQKNTALSEDRRRALVTDLYTRHVADPADALLELGVLRQLDPARHSYQPRAHRPDQVSGIEALLAALTAEPVIDFRPARGLAPSVEALQRAAVTVRETRPDVSGLVDAYMARAIVTS